MNGDLGLYPMKDDDMIVFIDFNVVCMFVNDIVRWPAGHVFPGYCH